MFVSRRRVKAPSAAATPMYRITDLVVALPLLALAPSVSALERPEITFRVFQFPADQIPRVDGKTDDWAIVPESYVVGTDQLIDADKKHDAPDPKSLDVRVRVGWVQGLNRLYFLYEATDNYWDYSQPGLHNDTFELVVDGDASGGPLADRTQKNIWAAETVGVDRATPDQRISPRDARNALFGVHAQNYHIFTPAVGKDWAMVWGGATWIKELPYANAASSFDFKPGQPGKYVLEFWITPFDYAGREGPERAVESVLAENKIIGLGWMIMDYDDVAKNSKDGFWTISRHRSMFGDATYLPAFQLMPLEPNLAKPIEANWNFKIIDEERRVAAFLDRSVGKITSWKWDFGDGTQATEQNPIHTFEKPGNYTVVLDIEGPAGSSRRSKIWEVQLK
jgi:hypothetical protein